MRISGIDGVDQLAREFGQMSTRAQNLRPVGPAIHGELLVHHRKLFAYKPVGRMNHLGPSIAEASHPNHVFVATESAFEFGTSVEYARAYEDNQTRTIVECDNETGGLCSGHIADYVLTGEVANVA